MRLIGFSTGSLAFGDFRKALEMMSHSGSNAVELSALREAELEPLMAALPDLNLTKYQYYSFHAPSKLVKYTESQIVNWLFDITRLKYFIIVHPDVINDFKIWRKMGSWLCIENMDKRKPTGRTADELKLIFERLPEASFCFDIGHARQVDPTMLESRRILNMFKDRIKQYHLSEVNSKGIHEPLSLHGIWSYKRFANYLNNGIPIILETPVSANELDKEIEKANMIISKTISAVEEID